MDKGLVEWVLEVVPVVVVGLAKRYRIGTEHSLDSLSKPSGLRRLAEIPIDTQCNPLIVNVPMLILLPDFMTYKSKVIHKSYPHVEKLTRLCFVDNNGCV